MIEIKIQITLDATSGAMLKQRGLAKMKKLLTTRIGELLEDLGITVPFSVVASVDSTATSPFAVDISGQRARSSYEIRNAGYTDAREIAVSIMSVVFANRRLLISQANANELRNVWSDAVDGLCIPGLSRKAFRNYLRELATRCYKLDRGSCLQSAIGPTGHQWTSERCFERTVRSLDLIQLVLHHPTQFRMAAKGADTATFREMSEMMQDGLFYELGVRIPRIRLAEDKTLEPDETRLQINDVRLPPKIRLSDAEFLVAGSPDELKLLGIKGRAATNPANGNECAIVADKGDNRERCEESGLATWGQNGYTVLQISRQVREHAGCFINEGTLRYDFDMLKPRFDSLVRNLTKRFEDSFVTQVLRHLADEQISFRNLRDVLQALLAITKAIEVDSSEFICFPPYGMLPYRSRSAVSFDNLDASQYAETVRAHMKRYISHKYTRGGNTLVVYLLDPPMETRIAESSIRPLDDDERLTYLEAVAREVEDLPAYAQNPVVLTLSDVRKPFHDLVEYEFPDLAVVCYEELSPDMSIQPIARIAA